MSVNRRGPGNTRSLIINKVSRDNEKEGNRDLCVAIVRVIGPTAQIDRGGRDHGDLRWSLAVSPSTMTYDSFARAGNLVSLMPNDDLDLGGARGVLDYAIPSFAFLCVSRANRTRTEV